MQGDLSIGVGRSRLLQHGSAGVLTEEPSPVSANGGGRDGVQLDGRAGAVDTHATTCSISVVIPTLNEAENLYDVLPSLPPEHEVIIVDGGSSDATVEAALMLRPDAIVLHHPVRGKGSALLCGFLAATGDIIVTFDADGSARAAEIPRFVAALMSGADFAKGSRYLEGGGSADVTPLRNLGNRLLATVVNRLYGTAFTDLCYGYNAFWRRCLPFMPAQSAGFEIETLIHIYVARAALTVVEVPSYEEPRRFGESKLHSFRDGSKILWVIVRERFASRARRRHAQPSPALERERSTTSSSRRWRHRVAFREEIP